MSLFGMESESDEDTSPQLIEIKEDSLLVQDSNNRIYIMNPNQNKQQNSRQSEIPNRIIFFDKKRVRPGEEKFKELFEFLLTNHAKNQYFYNKEENYWFDKDNPNIHFDEKYLTENLLADFDVSIIGEKIYLNNKKNNEKKNSWFSPKFPEWCFDDEYLLNKQKEEKEKQEKEKSKQQKQKKIDIDSTRDENQKQEEINNAIKRAENFQKARNEKTIKQLKKQKEPVDINLKKCETFNPGYAKILKEKLESLEQKGLNVHAKPLEQNSDSKTNSQKSWIFRNPNLEKQKNQNEPNDNAVVKNEIALKDLENSKLVWVENPDEKTRSIIREKDFYKDENLIEQAGVTKNQKLSSWPYGPDYELKVLNDETNSQKPWIFRNPKEQNENLAKQNEKDLKEYLVYKNAESAWQENSDDKELWTIIGKGKKQESLELQPIDPNFMNIDTAKLSAKPLEQNFDPNDNLSLAGHGDFNIQEQDIDSNDNFWKLWSHIPKNQEENDNFKLFGYEVFNSNNSAYEYPKPYQYKDHEFEKEHKKFRQQTPDEAKKEAVEQAKKRAAEKARRDWLKQLETAKRTGTEQGTVAYAAHRVAAQKPIVDAFHQGAIGGIEHGTATAVASLILMAMQAVVEKGVKWWNQPNSKELAQLTQKMQLQQVLKALHEGIEKNQKSLESMSPVITTIGNNVEQAQQIFEKQLNQKREELIDEIHNNEQVKRTIISDLEARKKQNLAIFKVNSAREREKIIKEFKQQQGISNNPSGEQAKKLEEFIQNLKKDMSQKEQQFIRAQKAELTLEKQKEDYIKVALNILSQASPEAKFYAVHDEYTDRALEILQSQRAMMNVATNNVRVGFNEKQSRLSRNAPAA